MTERTQRIEVVYTPEWNQFSLRFHVTPPVGEERQVWDWPMDRQEALRLLLALHREIERSRHTEDQ